MSTQQRSALDRAAPLVGRPVVWQPSPDGGIGFSVASRMLGLVFIPADPDDGSVDQTERVQAALDGCLPGQTAVLPPPVDAMNRYVRCGTVTLPSAVNLESGGSSPIGWTLKFRPSTSQAFNSRVGRIWFKQSRADLSADPEEGTAGAGSTLSVIQCPGKSWTPNQWKDWNFRINTGTGAGQASRRIISNTANTLTLEVQLPTTAPNATSGYAINGNLSTIVFDGTQFDGTDLNNSGATSGTAIKIGNLAFDIRLINGLQIWNYGGWGIAVYGNSDELNNTGITRLATGVFITGDHVKIFNCGGAGSGGGILLKGAPRDGGSLHFGTLLLDHCQHALYVDPCVNGDPNVLPVGSGGWTASIDSLRVELCGKIGESGVETPSIVNVRGHVAIGFLWYSSAVLTQFYRNIWHRNGSFTVREGRMVKGGSIDTTQTYGVYCDQTKVAKCSWVASYNYDIGLQKVLTAADTSANGLLASFRFQIKKTAGGLTVQNITTNGGGFGIGHGAGDQFSGSVSADITNGGGTVTVGSGFATIYYQLSAGGGLLRVQPAFRTVNKVLATSLLQQSAGIANLTADTRLLNGTTDFTIAFRNSAGAEVNLNSTMGVGQTIDVQVIVAMNDV